MEKEPLVRQLADVRTKDVRDRLQPIRSELRTESEALDIRKKTYEQGKTPEREPENAPKKSDKSRELSASQDIAAVMLKQEKAKRKAANDNSPLAKYRSNKDSPLEKYRTNDNSPLEKYRYKPEDSPLAKYRSQKDNTTRNQGRTRDHNEMH